MRSKIYISGKISGIEETAYELFHSASLKLANSGYDVINPMTLNHDHDKSWIAYMREDIKALCDCDSIFMLENWTDSKGAIIEHNVAVSLGLEIIYENL